VNNYLIIIYEMEATSDIPNFETKLRVETVRKNARITLLEPGTSWSSKCIKLYKIIISRVSASTYGPWSSYT
jgi:hypothetical protein